MPRRAGLRSKRSSAAQTPASDIRETFFSAAHSGAEKFLEIEGDSMDSTQLRIDGLTKTFAGVPAVIEASLSIQPGEVLALLGENGAGKSTLMKTVSGIYPFGSYTGRIFLGSRELQLRSIREAEAEGIVLVPQELHVAPNLSIAENIMMGVLPTRFGVLDRNEMTLRAEKCLSFFGLNFDSRQPADVLSASEQRLLSISAALSKGAARVLILDEPTASLTDGEAEHLFEKVRQVSATGVATIFITHRLDEIERVCTSAAVMRNGRVVLRLGEVAGKRDELVHAMIGRDPKQHETKRKPTPGKTILHVSGLVVRNHARVAKPVVENLSLEVRAGEIVGLFGLVGAGRTEFAKAIFGAWHGEVEGSVTINGKAGRPESPHEAIGRRVAMLTEDRKRSGIIEGQSAFHNISAASISRVTRLSVIDRKKERDRNVSLARKLDVRPFRLDAAIETFSGGNQQKIILARWMATDPDLLIADEPTYGVDVGARFEIYQLLRELADVGKAILLISSDLEEIVNETDRVVVMYKGRIAGEFPCGSSRHQLMAAATGDLKQTPAPNAA